MSEERVIKEFQGEYRFLSNFWPSPIEFEDNVFPTVEHLYQWMKQESNPEIQKKILASTSPGEAKKLGRAKLTPQALQDWEDTKEFWMSIFLIWKFCRHRDLGDKLLSTGDAILQEGNRWGDTFWGVDLRTGVGENRLGILLMEKREIVHRLRGYEDANRARG